MNCGFEEVVCLISNHHVISKRRRGHKQDGQQFSCRKVEGEGGEEPTQLPYQQDLKRVYLLVSWEDNRREKTVSTVNRGDQTQRIYSLCCKVFSSLAIM